MSADINIVEFNYSFLKSLESDVNLSTSKIKFKFTEYLKPKTYTQQFSDVDAITITYPDVKLSKAARKCMYGDFSKIEEVLITNKNFPFYNEFQIYNITGTIRVVDKVQFNGLNSDFYTQEIQRFKKLLVSTFNRYLTSWNTHKAMMDECYVVSCYVDKYYNCPDNKDEPSTTTITYPDVFVDAGPNQIADISYGTPVPLFTVTGATHAIHSGATIKWTINTTNISIDNDTLLTTTFQLVNLPPLGNNNYTLTLTVTYPWGPIVVDTKNILVSYFLFSSLGP